MPDTTQDPRTRERPRPWPLHDLESPRAIRAIQDRMDANGAEAVLASATLDVARRLAAMAAAAMNSSAVTPAVYGVLHGLAEQAADTHWALVCGCTAALPAGRAALPPTEVTEHVR